MKRESASSRVGTVLIRMFGTFVSPLCDPFSRVIKRALTNGRVFNDR